VSSTQAIARKRCAFAATNGSPARTVSTIASSRLRTAWLTGIAARPTIAIAFKPMISRSASGDGGIPSAVLIHCDVGMATSRVRIAAPNSQFTTMRTRRTRWANGRAADDEAGFDMLTTF